MENSLIRKPSHCSISIIEQCMLKCKMCNHWKVQRHGKGLSIEEWKTFLVSLKEFMAPSTKLVFSGGEPLLFEGILDLVRFSTGMGFSVAMPTNAFLIDKIMARRIADSGLQEIVISLDSFKKETHDFLRGVKGCHEKAIKAIKYLGQFKKHIKINILTVISGKNLDDLVELVKWVSENDALSHIHFQAIVQPFFSPVENEWYKKDNYKFLWPENSQKAVSVVDELINLKEKGRKVDNKISQLKIYKAYFENPGDFAKNVHCNLRDYGLSINSQGDIYLCGDMESIGNLRKEPINKIWYSEKTDQIRKQIECCHKVCNLLINCCFEEQPL